MASNGSERERPRIGVTTYVETARWGIWERRAALLPHAYVSAVLASGGLPILLPPAPDAAAARSAIGGIDGLILAGGADVDPACYGSRAQPETVDTRPDRDQWERTLVAEALDGDLPVLAICRGMQLLNVALGGTLQQHLPDRVGHDGHCPGDAVYGVTRVRFAPGTAVAAILGSEGKVRCYHHQAVDRPGRGVRPVAWADDGTIEAVVVGDRRFLVGVQWHPENGDDPRLFEALTSAARHTANGAEAGMGLDGADRSRAAAVAEVADG